MESEALAAAAFAMGTEGNLVKGGAQFVRTALRGHVHGLSAGAVWLAVLANALWASFGAAISDVPFLALSLFGLLLTSATAARLAARTGWRRNASRGAVTVASAVGCAALAGMGEDQALAVIGVTLGLLMSLPQVVHLVRIRKTAQDVSGVSTVEYVVVIASQLGWTSYWLLSQQWLVAAGAAWGGAARVVTLVLLLRRAERSRVVVEPG